ARNAFPPDIRRRHPSRSGTGPEARTTTFCAELVPPGHPGRNRARSNMGHARSNGFRKRSGMHTMPHGVAVKRALLQCLRLSGPASPQPAEIIGVMAVVLYWIGRA